MRLSWILGYDAKQYLLNLFCPESVPVDLGVKIGLIRKIAALGTMRPALPRAANVFDNLGPLRPELRSA